MPQTDKNSTERQLGVPASVESEEVRHSFQSSGTGESRSSRERTSPAFLPADSSNPDIQLDPPVDEVVFLKRIYYYTAEAG